MPGPSVRSPVEEFRRRRRETRDAAARESGRMPDRVVADPNQSARERWRQETVDALRQAPPIPRLDQASPDQARWDQARSDQARSDQESAAT